MSVYLSMMAITKLVSANISMVLSNHTTKLTPDHIPITCSDWGTKRGDADNSNNNNFYIAPIQTEIINLP